MLSIAQVSGLIAAAVMVVQYALPAGLVVILVKYIGNENTAATWSSVNRTISNTVWPLLLQADSVGTKNRSLSAMAISWAMTLGAILLVVAGIMAPLGLREEIAPGPSEPVYFQYAKDLTSWGRITMPRPDHRFGRYCEFGRRINCPGQYQGVDLNETSPGSWESVKTDNSSTVNTTLPANFTAMFSSATNDAGNTLSGLFDIQYRRWKASQEGIIDHGEPRVRGNYRYIETLIPQDDVLIKEGLIINVRETPGIGFRNHTVPIDLVHGGTWSEDLTWLEPVTSCVDTNLTIQIEIVESLDWRSNETVYLVDRGAFRDLDLNALESHIWNDNQTLDLFGRAYKAARMYNVFVADFLNVSLPLDPDVETIPKIDMQINARNKTLEANEQLFSTLNPDVIRIGKIEGIQDYLDGDNQIIPPPDDFVPRYDDGWRKLFASNFTAIRDICRGYYLVEDSIDWRASNITNPGVECGLLIGGGRSTRALDGSNPSPRMNSSDVLRKNMYICASAVRASIKTVDFRYNGTNGHLPSLNVERISDKVYPDELSKPLWAVEYSEPERMTFDPLWGLVNDSYETADGIHTMRSEKLWLPAIVSDEWMFGSLDGMDSLAAVSAPVTNVANVYTALGATEQYTNDLSYPLVERFIRLSLNQTTASQIPSLMITDSLASILVGTKTAIRADPVEYPAQMAVNDPLRGLSRANVVAYRRVIRYDLRYAIPGLIVLTLMALVVLWAAVILVLSRRGILIALRDMYNQTSTGRLATALLCPGRSDPNEPSSKWIEGDGKLVLNFGRFGTRESDYFVILREGSGRSLPYSEPERSPRKVPGIKEGMREETVRF
ncbi:hypothetical protein DL765_003160 [Monosporascus sp. GIB2]|nr:hypothetical protein DL765_003160 [Monosporascus sp. GIB2]